MNPEDEPTPKEREAAARLADSLETDETAELIRAAAGRASPLGELRARALARAAAQAALRQRPRRLPALLAGLAVALILLAIGLRRDPPPERLRARSAGLLVPGPFPAAQTAAQRLDLVTSDRLLALREARYQRGAK